MQEEERNKLLDVQEGNVGPSFSNLEKKMLEEVD